MVSRFVQNSSELNYIVKQAKKNQLTETVDDGTLSKFYKIQKTNDLIVAEHIEATYGFKGIGYTNLIDLFDATQTGYFDVYELRSHLIG